MNLSWTIQLDGQPYTVVLEHGLISGNRIIQVNGVVVHRSRKIIDVGESAHDFPIAGTKGRITILSQMSDVTYSLYINGVLFKSQVMTTLELSAEMRMGELLVIGVVGAIHVLILASITLRAGTLLTYLNGLNLLAFLAVAFGIWTVAGEKSRPFWLRVGLCALFVVIDLLVIRSLV